MSVPFTGGFSAYGHQRVVDGNFYDCDPCSPPKVSWPFKGDSVFSNNSVIFWDELLQSFQPLMIGQFPNIQPWSANQRCFVIEQDFMVAMEAYRPLPLNTPYWYGWSIGWQGMLTNGYPLYDLSAAIFVEEEPLEDMGQGIMKVRRRFAVPPPTRNEIEQFCYHYPGFALQIAVNRDGTFNINQCQRKPFDWVVPSRIQYDYFVFDDYGILPYGVYPNGPILNSKTGIYPDSLIMEQQIYYVAISDGSPNPIDAFLFQADGQVVLCDEISFTTESGTLTAGPTNPTLTQWQEWLGGVPNYGGGYSPPEIVAEASTMRRWMGNIWERRTRFVQVK
ncbi:MAG: hypothetical protein KGL39_21725 [Patescibacteria group bacterium]|nr:hypothetical protein [Patescibacteria group bacterium]